MTVTLAALATAVALAAPAWVVIGLFPLLGFGIGTLYPRVTAQALGRAGYTEQGFVSSALQIGDSAGAATALALSAIAFTAAGSGCRPRMSRSWRHGRPRPRRLVVSHRFGERQGPG